MSSSLFFPIVFLLLGLVSAIAIYADGSSAYERLAIIAMYIQIAYLSAIGQKLKDDDES